MVGNDERWLVLVTSAVKVAGWVITGVVIILALVFVKPIVELVAGRQTGVQISVAASASITLNGVSGLIIWRLKSRNQELQRTVQQLQSGKRRPSGQQPARTGKRT